MRGQGKTMHVQKTIRVQGKTMRVQRKTRRSVVAETKDIYNLIHDLAHSISYYIYYNIHNIYYIVKSDQQGPF